MQKYAAIDIGTNSMRLLLCNVEDGKITAKTKYINPTRIGSSVDKEGLISEEGIVRNLEAFQNFVEKAKEYGAEKVCAIATSAVRDAKNGKDFIQRALDKTGIKIEIISGEEEAALGYKGVVIGLEEKESKALNSVQYHQCQKSKNILVIDIGGGSTELILGQGARLTQTISLNVGAVRMTERHITTEPVNKKEQEKMEADIYEITGNSIEQIKEELVKSHQHMSDNHNSSTSLNPTLIGIGGTITTLAALHQQLEPYDPNKVHNYKLTLEDIITLKEKLLSLTIEEIRNLKGIHPKRADIIAAGATILHLIMDRLNICQIIVSEYDNLEGLVVG